MTRYETARVDRGRIVAQVTATGTLSALVTVQVGSQVSGRIQQLFVDFNSPVKKGQLIAKIDPQLFQATLEQARANHIAARADLARAKVQAADAARQLARTRSLAERKLVAQADLDTAQATAEGAQAGVDAAAGKVEQARASLHQAQVNLAYTTIISPIDGIVISRSVDVGQTVAASLQAPTLFVIAEDLAKMQVDTSVAEADVGKLRAGDGRDVHRRRLPRKTLPRDRPADPQRAAERAERRHLRRGHRRREPGPRAAPGHDRQRDLRLRRPRGRPARPERGAALPAVRRAQAGRRGGAGAAGGGAGAGAQGAPDGGGRGAASPGQAPVQPRPEGRRPGAGEGSPREPDRRTVWVLRAATPEAAQIRTGVSDGTTTEVLEGELREGDRS